MTAAVAKINIPAYGQRNNWVPRRLEVCILKEKKIRKRI